MRETLTGRTSSEVRAYYDATRNEDVLGFIAEVLLPRCDYDDVSDLVKADVIRDVWESEAQESRDPSTLLDEMRDYLAFAWEKARDHRGISAGRSLQKLQAYAWLLGDTEGANTIRDRSEADYYPYGAPVLAWIAGRYYDHFPEPPEDEALANMIAGKPCSIECAEGC